MKSPRLLGLLAPLCAALASASAAPVESTITAVTVYADRAVVTRSASTTLSAGTTELVFANLPAALNEQSLQVGGRGTAAATILDVSARKTFVDFTPNERVKALEDELLGLNRQQRVLDDRAAVLQAQRSLVDRMEAALVAPPAKDVPRPDVAHFTNTMTFVVDQRTKIAADLAALDIQKADLADKITAVQNQLNQLRGAGGRATKSVTVRVATTTAGSLDLTLSYQVPGATWAPTYDARVATADRSVQLVYSGLVRQNTGEDWKNVALTLSTARPSLGGAAPELGAWNLNVAEAVAMDAFRVEEARRGARREMTAKSVAAPAAVGMALNMAAPAEMEDKDATVATAAIEQGATSASFRIAAASTIPSDNSPQKVPITSAALKAATEYAATPKRQAVAFLTAKVTNNTEFPLLAGAMNVFLEGTFVATSRLQTVMPEEKFDLALGADEGISVKHKRVQKFSEETGLTNSGRRITYEYLITIQNNKKTAEKIVVTDQVPVSRNEKIVVRQMVPAQGELKPDNEGRLKWTLDLKPGEKRDLMVKFTVEYPKEVEVVGLE